MKTESQNYLEEHDEWHFFSKPLKQFQILFRTRSYNRNISEI